MKAVDCFIYKHIYKRVIISRAKFNCPDQSGINLTNSELFDACKSLLSKGPSFVPTPYDINWYTLMNYVSSPKNPTRLQKIL